MDKIFSYLVRRGFRPGLLGGDAKWLAFGAAALLARSAVKAFRKKPEVVFAEKLRAGERLVISHVRQNGRNENPAPQP